MRIALAALVCLLAVPCALGQTNGNEGADDAPAISISIAKEEKDGTIAEGLETIGPNDIPLICYIDLPTDDSTVVKMVIVAVKAVGLRANSNYITVSYKTSEGENQVAFNARPASKWPAGSYRVDVFIDGKKAGSKDFKVVAN
ncbi:MAG: hypothetical protein IPM63_09355 [Acidobacteriota bacterium]|nr:MAG: hypothetical protein IPM63_09355 [Acidobacteriota bacterium]